MKDILTENPLCDLKPHFPLAFTKLVTKRQTKFFYLKNVVY